ncbi:hypothetical protein EMPS_07212 [Entomortierella parvispora]|uniref:Ras GEF n=1 Tax=Entomortierella parvispora TaxID=205924 RepID=A0A9P3HDS4_9FUNG|nr:hypothetical protein EMPS_07212 [Entomortierella parvispora]
MASDRTTTLRMSIGHVTCPPPRRRMASDQQLRQDGRPIADQDWDAFTRAGITLAQNEGSGYDHFTESPLGDTRRSGREDATVFHREPLSHHLHWHPRYTHVSPGLDNGHVSKDNSPLHPFKRSSWGQHLVSQEQSQRSSDRHPSLSYNILETLEEHHDHHSYSPRPLPGNIYSTDQDFNSETEVDTDEENGRRNDFSLSMTDIHGARLDRMRSLSVCVPLSPNQTPVGSPRQHSSNWVAESRSHMSGSRTPRRTIGSDVLSAITTPTPRSKNIHAGRRRHNSYVAPNTKEFNTLSTIFGWVTVSAEEAWSRARDHNTSDPSLDSQVDHSRRIPSYESGDDSDTDDFSPFGAISSWSNSQTSGSSGNAEISPSSLFGDTASSRNSGVSSLGGQSMQSQGTTLFSGEELALDADVEATRVYSGQPTGPRRASHNRYPISFSPTRPLDRPDMSLPQPEELPKGWTGNQRRQTVHAFIERDKEFTPHITPRRKSAGRIPNGFLPPPTGPLPAVPFSPLSGEFSDLYSGHNSNNMFGLPRSFGKDSGYMSASQQFSLHPLESIPVYTEDTATVPRMETTSVKKLGKQFDPLDNVQSPEPTPTTLVPPPVPPPFLEIDARVFDITEAAEGCSTIVYAQQPETASEGSTGSAGLKPIVAGTIVKLIEKLTHQYGMNSGFITDFFLTYRLFMSPVQLCKYLIQRYLWALELDTESRCVVRVRTFVVFRHWINNHFEDDFLTSKSLRFQMASFLNQMRFNHKVQTSARDSRIIRNLMDFFKQQRRHYKALAEESFAAEQAAKSRSGPIGKDGSSPAGPGPNDDVHPFQPFQGQASEVPVDVSKAWRDNESSSAVKTTKSDISDSIPSSLPPKARTRATTLAGGPLGIVTPTDDGTQTTSRSTKGKEVRVQIVSRQTSDNSMYAERERRLSGASIKSARSSTWSTKMTQSIHKLRQKSEDIFQQFVHPTSLQMKSEFRQCVCWTPTFTGIADHHALNTTRSYPILRSSAVGSGVSSPDTSSAIGQPSNRSIKRLKSSLTLGSNTSSCPVTGQGPLSSRSPTRAQFSTLSSRHSRTNSSNSVGFHPNPDCPFHVACMESIQSIDQAINSNRVSGDSTYNSLESKVSVHEFLNQEPYPIVPSLPNSVPPSPAWPASPSTHGDHEHYSAVALPYKPFILFYRSQTIAQQLCLLEQHYLEQIQWEELLELELSKAGRKKRSKSQSSISGYLFKSDRKQSGMDASNERSNKLCMWVASEVVSTQPIEDRVRVIEKFIRIAQKCYQYRNFNSLIQLVMGLGSSQLCGLRRTWSRVGGYEMHVLQDLQEFISPCSNWNVLRRAMNQVNQNEPEVERAQRFNHQAPLDTGAGVSPNGVTASSDIGLGESEASHSKYLQNQVPFDQQGCIPFLGLFVFDLTHIAVSPSWYLAPSSTSQKAKVDDNIASGAENDPSPEQQSRANEAVSLVAPEPQDLPDLLSTGTLLVHLYKFQLIAKTIKWFIAFQRRPRKYTFTVDPTLYSKCYLLRVLKEDRLRELAETCESD